MEDTKEKQHKLAAVIKGVHSDLRKRYKSDKEGFDKAWNEHCQNDELLSQYASAMYELATDIWAPSNTETRIDWCKGICQEYFHNGGLEKAIEKDKRRQRFKEASQQISKETAAEDCMSASDESASNFTEVCLEVTEKIQLLDVGSCYNPFAEDPHLLPLAIDLSPAVKGVLQCDFLKLKISETQSPPICIDTITEPVTSLPSCSFHVVVFSLLLEYLPSAQLRWLCCEKAHRLLALNGLLLIVTPDSNHQNKNAPRMKRWKAAIESLGFSRWRYVKQEHLHCIAFRKTQPETTGTLQGAEQMLSIPQDFSAGPQGDRNVIQTTDSTSSCEESECEKLHELPFCGDFDL